ncbi:MAG: hypothetical protein L0Y60_13240, partial [Beijerinckiaceae bacterium]|nr:hypothetical protein [Beijerinckiaceae bacterium]
MPCISGISAPANNRVLAAMLALLPLAGCSAVGPDFEAPDPLLPRVSFSGKPEPSAVADHAPAPSAKGDALPADPNWWEAF